MAFINKINTYINDRGIEIHEEETIDGASPKGRPQYEAFVTIGVDTPEGQIPQQISTKFHAIGIKDAFKKAEKELNKEIKIFGEKLKKQVEEAKEAAFDEAAPKLIVPD